ncbi:MAG: hypothetical protein WBO35_03805 [Candidatus Saccharimonadales bacterium]
MKKIIFLVTFFLAGTAQAITPWNPSAKTAYVANCSSAMSQQGMPTSQASAFCQCAANGMEAEFGMERYQEMMAAQPSPTGSAADRKLNDIMGRCAMQLKK